MRRFLTLSLLWLFTLALPLQGAASIAMTLCGPAHERMMQGQQTRSDSAEHSHAGGATDHAQHHSKHTSGEDKGTSDHAQSSGCSACSACCPSGAMSNGYAVPGPHVVSSNPLSAEVPLYAGVVADGPEHPPRLVILI